jgi:hypothetical protein
LHLDVRREFSLSSAFFALQGFRSDATRLRVSSRFIRIRLAKICRSHEAFPGNLVEHFLTSVPAAFSSILAQNPDFYRFLLTDQAVYFSRLFLTRLTRTPSDFFSFLVGFRHVDLDLDLSDQQPSRITRVLPPR